MDRVGPQSVTRLPSIEVRLAALGFAALAFDLGSVLIKAPLAWRGVTWGDAIEVAGVYVVLLLYRSIRSAATVRAAGTRATLLELGHGVHVAANSAHDMLSVTGGADPWGLVTLWDEGIGHALADLGRVAFAIGLTWTESAAALVAGGGASRAPARPEGHRWLLPLGAVAYGFIYFGTAVEGQTAPLALPFCAAYAAWSAWRTLRSRRSGAVDTPIRAFYTIASWIALLLFAVWGTMEGGLPEFTKVGIL